MIRVSFESRTVFGSAPVLRVLDRSSTLFYENPWVRPSANWTRTSADVFIRPASGNVGLCLYAFGDQAPTSVQFRALSVMPWPAGIGDLAWLGGSNPNELPVKFTASGVTRYDIAVPKGAKLLVLRSSFAPGWTLESAGHILGYAHVPVDGYLNGWLLPSEAPSSIAAIYAPARAYQVLLWIAGLVFASMVLVTIALWTRALLLRRGRPDPREREANDVKAAR